MATPEDLNPRQRRILELVVGAQEDLVKVRRAMTLGDLEGLLTNCHSFADNSVELAGLVDELVEEVSARRQPARTQPGGPSW
jgi:hypothetical protein